LLILAWESEHQKKIFLPDMLRQVILLTHTLKIAGVINARILLAGKAGNQLPTTNDLPVSYLYDPLQEYIGIGTKMIFSRKEKYGIVVSPFGAIMAKRVAYAWALNFGFFYKW